MKIKHRQFGFELKSLDNKGAFAGYGSVFGNADAYRDVVMPGAFAQTLSDWSEKDALPPILWQHDSRNPVGPFTSMAEDGTGLYCEGQLLIKEVPQAAVAYALLKSKTIRGMSIGYDVTDEEYDGKTNVNRLKAVDLWEVSLATFPANTDAQVTQVKSMIESGDTPTIRQFESLLRDAGGYSRKQAEQIAKFGYASFLEQRDAGRGDDETEIESVLALFKEHPIQL
jgi:HK97 family phage prohead protease